MRVAVASVLEHEYPRQVHGEAEDGHQQQALVVHVGGRQRSLQDTRRVQGVTSRASAAGNKRPL